MSGPEAWRMHAAESPLFTEYVNLAYDAGWSDLVKSDSLDSIGAEDALIVVDLQNDFVPVDKANPHGGAFAVAEGANVCPLSVQLMEHFSARGATVVATRDYHPAGHCSFISEGGPFPAHCLQGTIGSYFYEPIGFCISKLQLMCDDVHVAFKGFHEDVDSFGGFPYEENEESYQRLSNRREKADLVKGCSACCWTGCFKFKCTNQRNDVNAPPDVLAAMRKQTLADVLKRRSVRRVFACGLAMDFCVLDTCLNAREAGFSEVYMVLDATRAAHLPGVGSFGSGFLSDPAELKKKMLAKGVGLVPTAALVPNFELVNAIDTSTVMRGLFPKQLGPMSLSRSKKLALWIDREKLTYKATLPLQEIGTIERFGFLPVGRIAPPSPITLEESARRNAGIPKKAVEFCWCYPVDGFSTSDRARSYFSITTPAAAFLVYGGYVYFDRSGRVIATMAISLGEGLFFGPPRPWPRHVTSALADRWNPITAPFLKSKGAQHFVWLNPGEVVRPKAPYGLKPEDVGPDFVVGPGGAFAYLFHEDIDGHDDRNACFEVQVMTSQPPQLGRIASGTASEKEKEGEAVVNIIRKRANTFSGKAADKVIATFEDLDADGSGEISKQELRAALKVLAPNLSTEAVDELFASADYDGDGSIDYDDFVRWIFTSDP